MSSADAVVGPAEVDEPDDAESEDAVSAAELSVDDDSEVPADDEVVAATDEDEDEELVLLLLPDESEPQAESTKVPAARVAIMAVRALRKLRKITSNPPSFLGSANPTREAELMADLGTTGLHPHNGELSQLDHQNHPA